MSLRGVLALLGVALVGVSAAAWSSAISTAERGCADGRANVTLALAALPPRPLALEVLAVTIPAHGHYRTTKDLVVALARRGHRVRFALCPQNWAVFREDRLDDLGIELVRVPNCSLFDGPDDVMRDIIRKKDLQSTIRMFENVAALSKQMCSQLFGRYGLALPDGPAVPPPATDALPVPDVVVFDADSSCGADLALRLGRPGVARVGTGVRDIFTTPLTHPIPMSGTSLFATGGLSCLGSVIGHLLSRAVLQPLLSRNVFARNRRDLGIPAGEDPWDPTVPFDGFVTLYNSHWGLEYARKLRPTEHLAGHLTDYCTEADQTRLRPALRAWLDAPARERPVVYVALGTLTVLDPAVMVSLARALEAVEEFDVVWAMKGWRDWLACACGSEGGGDGGHGEVGSSPSTATAPKSSSNSACEFACHPVWRALLQRNAIEQDAENAEVDPPELPYNQSAVDTSVEPALPPVGRTLRLEHWVPQVALLDHPAVSVFLTHGGMNGVSEGTFAHTPLLCIPLYGDQPDNCQHAADFGFALRLNVEEVADTALVHDRLHTLHHDPSFRLRIADAWKRNLATGGIGQAVRVVEDTAVLGTKHLLEFDTTRPFLERLLLSELGLGLSIGLALGLALSLGCSCLARRCRGGTTSAASS